MSEAQQVSIVWDVSFTLLKEKWRGFGKCDRYKYTLEGILSNPESYRCSIDGRTQRTDNTLTCLLNKTPRSKRGVLR